MQQFDLAVIGGGLVGSSFVRAVSGLGLRVLVIDRAPAISLYNHNLDNRGLALSYTTKQTLDELQCWVKIATKAYPIETVHVSEQKCFGFTKLESKDYNINALGYVVSASDLAAALLTDLELLPGVTVLRPTVIEDIVFESVSRTWSISVAQQRITAKLIVAADGSNSILHSQQNISIHNVNLQQAALVTNLETIMPSFTIAYERFSRNGVLAILPFGAYRAKCVFTGSELYVSQLLNSSDADFINEIQNLIGYRLGKFKSVADRKMFSVTNSYANPIYGDSLVLLGNAANTLHPVAAQGFNLGVRDAIVFARVLQQAILDGKAINQSDILEKYATLRSNDHIKTRMFTNRLVDVFSDCRRHVRLCRQAGVLAAQFIPSINKKIIKQGLGRWK